jgi:flagellin
MVAQNSNVQNNANLNSSLEKLSSGLRINRAADDASGLSIADKLRTQASSLGQAVENGNAAITMIQIADKAMDEQSNILDTIKTKLTQAATATTTAAGVAAISADIVKLAEQLENIAENTNYNGQKLLEGTTGGVAATKSFQLGEFSGDTIDLGNGSATQTISGAIQASWSGIGGTVITSAGALSISTNAQASALMDDIDSALDTLNEMRSTIGSTQNKVESKVRNLEVTVTNVKAAESIIRDVDYAAESANFNKLNIISQAGTYAISQANTIQQNVTRLLQ